MKNKHCSGPWVHSYEGGWDVIRQHNQSGHIICRLDYNNPSNAELIARAPQMLNAIIQLGNRKDDELPCYCIVQLGPEHFHEETCRNIRSLIKQAKGLS